MCIYIHIYMYMYIHMYIIHMDIYLSLSLSLSLSIYIYIYITHDLSYYIILYCIIFYYSLCYMYCIIFTRAAGSRCRGSGGSQGGPKEWGVGSDNWFDCVLLPTFCMFKPSCSNPLPWDPLSSPQRGDSTSGIFGVGVGCLHDHAQHTF